MAKPKKYISSKLKVKRKFVLGGDPGQELYLNNNTTYQAVDAPTAMLQQQFDANEQLKAKQNTAIFGNQMARQMDYLQDLNAASEKRTKEEETARQQQAAANKQTVDQQVTQTAGKAGKQIAKDYKAGLFNTVTPVASNYYSPTWAPVTPAPVAPVGPAPVMINPAMQTATSTTGDLFAGAPTVGQNMATTTTTSGFGQSAAAIGKSLGSAALVAAPQIAGQIAYNQLNKADDRQMKREGRSEYYDDTDYSRKEFNAQMLKSTGKGATIGGTIGSMIPIPGVGTGLGMAIGAGIGAGVGAIKATHQRRMTKDESERGVKVGNKRFGKKLLFGEENVYDENLDPTVIEKRNREAQLKAMTETANAMDNATLSSMTQYDTNTGFNLKSTSGQMAKYGGKLEYLKGGVAKSLGRGAKEYVGKSHEQGGIDLPGNIEVEGGETEQNNYIFSKHLKLHTGISYAQAHKNLLKSGASSEEIKQLALSQEAAAGRNPNEIKTMKFAKYGGPIQYKKGGDTSEIQYTGIDPENEGFDANTIENAQVFQDTATGDYVYRAPDGTELGRSIDKNTAFSKAERNLAKKQNPIGVAPPATNQESNYKQQLAQALTNSGLSAEEFAKQNGIDVGLLNDVISGNKTLTADEASLLGAATSTKPVNNTGYSVPVDDKGNPKSAPTANTSTKPSSDAPTINNQLSTFENIAKTTGALDFTSPDAAGGIWAGNKYENEWKPLVTRTMSDDANADKVISYLENYSGQDAADVKAKLAGKTREQKIAAINRLATDTKVGPFHNAVLEGINSTQTPPPPPITPPPGTPPPASPPETPKRDYTMELPPPPKYVPTKSTSNIGLLQTIPAAYAAVNPINVKPIAPSLAMGYVTPGAVGRTNIGRVSYNTERATNQGNLSAMNQALQNMSGPGAVAGMLAAKTKADQQNLAIANAEQNQNVGLAAKEADLNAGISKFNVGNAMQAQTTNAGIAQQNAARMQQASQFNTQLKYAKDVENREQMLSALDRGTAAVVQNNLANRQLDSTERLAGVYDAYSAYNRYLGATQAQNNATKKEEETPKAKFGGAKKYVSRLGDLKNVKYKV